MKNILAIGHPAIKMSSQLASYPNYRIYGVDLKHRPIIKLCFEVPTLAGPEEYESICTKRLDKFLSKIKENLSVFVCGASDISGLLLKVLQPIVARGTKVDLIYIAPEREVLDEKSKLQENLVRNVVQQYARSAIFESVTLVSNLCLESIAGDTTVFDHFDKINSVFTASYYMLDVFRNSQPVSSTHSEISKTCRIRTIGLASLDSEEEKMFYPLEDVSEIIYYFGISEEKLKTEKNLFRKITNKVKDKIKEDTRVSFAIYSTQYEDDYIYIEYCSSVVQKN